MTEEDAKKFGQIALSEKIKMPWKDGLLDGDHIMRRIGDPLSNEEIAEAGTWRYEPDHLSWPDFRDTVTEAWLVAWGLAEVCGRP